MVLQRNAGLRWEIRRGLSEAGEMPADGWLEVIGYGDGGGSCKHT